jgi:thiol-disulfide isomerase/thioredoxin
MRPSFLVLAVSLSCFSYAARIIAAAAGPAVGSIAPGFRAHNLLTGETIPLSSQRGKVVILTFWASWCAPCRRELPILERAQEVLGKDKLVVFAVGFKENPAATNGIKKLAATWQINMISDDGWVAGRYAISSVPHLFIIGRDGRVLANHLGYGNRTLEELVSDINHALADPAPLAPEVSPPGAGDHPMFR